MNPAVRQKLKQAIACAALFCTAVQPTLAAVATPNNLKLATEPLFLGTNPTPKVMLTISKDQQLFKKAYNDYSDLDGDGQIETTYKHSISYYGYFDPTKCYEYAQPGGSAGKFEPRALAVGGLCTGMWHGNFLNWVAMTRMDAVRKLLYGGMRSTDAATSGAGLGQGTVLERAYLPTDAHAYAKFYNPGAPGSDPAQQPPIDRLTPFSGLPTTPAATAATTSSFTIPAAGGDYNVTFSAGLGTFSIGDQITMSTGAASMTGAVLNISGSTVTLRLNPAGIIGAGTAGTSWTVRNLSSTGISFCNLTTGASSGADQRSSTNTRPPIIRVARGNFALWSANERWQCQWFEERNNHQGGFPGGLRSNGNQATLSGIDASAEHPVREVHGLSTVGGVNGEYIARVQVCVPDLVGTEKCRSYGSHGVLKPYGLLQEYGEDNRVHFGLLTGSFQNNTNGGVLRKNIGTFADEVDLSNGTFSNPNHYSPPNAPRGPGSPATVAGIVNTLNYMRIYGYNYADGSYLGASGDNCTYQLTNLVPGNCTSWGNPMAEAFFESLRYFAGKTPQYGYGASSKDNELGLPQTAWTDPMTNTLYCAKMNVLVFNASVSTNEDDLQNTVVSSINGTATASALTTTVGDEEGVSGNTFFVGRTPASIPGATDFELCTPKTVNALGEALGICPEGPTLLGSYLIGGLGHFARTNRIRTAASLPLQVPPLPATDTTSLKVVSYGIQLATNTPELVITAPVPDSPRVVIQPLYRLHLPGNVFGGGALVDLKFVSQSWDPATRVATGKVYVNWEDSEQGGDYDQDMWGTLDWRLDLAAGTIAVTTNAISASTANPQGFGYTISGTNRDGPHFHSGIYGFNFTDPSGAIAQPANRAGCLNCRLVTENVAGSQTGPQTVTYSLGATAAGSLKDPLWYLAKYGGFTDQNGNGLPDQRIEWDTKKTDGTLVAGGDTVPDNYFLVTNPLGLEQALGAALAAVVQNSTAASVAANTTSLQVGSTVYAARFNPSDWSGNLEALPINSDGTLGAKVWDAQSQLRGMAHLERNIYTYNSDPTGPAASRRLGTRFLWNDIGANLKTSLNASPETGLNDNRGQLRLEYVRGDRTNETTAIGFRKRSAEGPLGDILNSNPAFVPEPNANIFDTDYRAFKEQANIKNRTHMVYVAANDGMLHGFDARTGKELLAYVPSTTFPKLNQLTSPTYVNKHRAYVDGSPEVADAKVNGTWKTVLVGAAGVGGQGLFALDVSDPATFPTADPKQLVLWEFNDTDDADLGYVVGQPVIRKMANGRWAAIVSGGYNNTEADGEASTDGNAYLFVIFLDGPTGANRTWQLNDDYIKIDTGVGFAQSPTSQPNGLARPLAADSDADGMVNFVYAGDLQGNFWKFDLSNPDPGVWGLASRRLILFTASNASGRQPITAQAEGALHPGGRGFVINFGTGKYLEEDDTKPLNFTVQSYYGVWDKNDSTVINSQTRITSRTQLLQQVLVDKSIAGRVVREIERDPVTGAPRVPDWSSIADDPPTANDSPPKHMGWYMDFPNGSTTGERAVFVPLIRGGRLIYTTLIPNGDPCQFGGSSVLMVLDPATGAAITRAVIDINGDGVLNSHDASGGTATDPVYASGLKSEIGITNTPRLVAKPIPASSGTAGAVLGATDPRSGGAGIRENYGIMCGSSGACVSPLLGLSSGTARVTWREVVRD